MRVWKFVPTGLLPRIQEPATAMITSLNSVVWSAALMTS